MEKKDKSKFLFHHYKFNNIHIKLELALICVHSGVKYTKRHFFEYFTKVVLPWPTNGHRWIGALSKKGGSQNLWVISDLKFGLEPGSSNTLKSYFLYVIYLSATGPTGDGSTVTEYVAVVQEYSPSSTCQLLSYYSGIYVPSIYNSTYICVTGAWLGRLSMSTKIIK